MADDDAAEDGGLVTDLQRRLREAEETARAHGEVIKMAAHDLRNPAAALQFQVQSLLRQVRTPGRTPTPEGVAARLEKMNRQADRLVRLIASMLDCLHLDSGLAALCPQQVDLTELLAEVAGRVQGDLEAADATLRLELDPGCTVRWDLRRVEQVLLTLLETAIQRGEGRALVASLRSMDGPRGRFVRYVVCDAAGAAWAERAQTTTKATSPPTPPAPPGATEPTSLGLWMAIQALAALGGQLVTHIGYGDASAIYLAADLPCSGLPPAEE